MKRFLVSALLISSFTPGLAKVSKISPAFVFEAKDITITGTKLNSVANPAKAILLDGEGEQFGEDLEIKNLSPTKFKITAPNVASTKSLVLRVTGGDVTEDEPSDNPIVIFNAPDLSNPDPDPPDNDISTTNLITEKVTFGDYTLRGDESGNLIWNGFNVINSSGRFIPKSILLNGFVMTTNTAGDLVWNSHTLSTAGGKIAATSVVNGSTAFSVAGSKTMLLNTGNGAVNVTLPSSGYIAGILRAEYDFATEGGIVGNINLRNATLPAKARVTRAWYEVITAVRSATNVSTIGFSIPTDDVNGILAPIAINDASTPFSVGLHSAIQSGSVSNFSEKTSTSRTVQMVLAGEALTAGKLVLYMEYYVTPY